MYLCYLDESGTPQIPGNTSHYILAGLSIPVWHWHQCDREINQIKRRFGIENDQEFHSGWMMRNYPEQMKVPDFGNLNYHQRKYEVTRLRKAELLRLQKLGRSKQYKRTRKNYRNSDAYIHLTFQERRDCVFALAECVSRWGFARVFAECIDKVHFDPARAGQSADEQAFEQVVSRLEQYLEATRSEPDHGNFGLLIHDNNQTAAKKLTGLMRTFHRRGTLWTSVHNIIETPLFVDSELTGMVQVADLCAYALRRYFENDEREILELILERADRRGQVMVGVRHFTNSSCDCKICRLHRS